MQSLFFFLPLFSAQPAQPTSLSLSFSSPAAQTPRFHRPTFLSRPRSAPLPLCRRQVGPACRGRLPPRGRRGLRESGRHTPPRAAPWPARQGSPTGPINSARTTPLASPSRRLFPRSNPSRRRAIVGASQSSASRRRSAVPSPILVGHATPELRVVVSNVSSRFSPPLSLSSARLSSPSPLFRSSTPRAPVRPSPRPPNPKMSSPSLALAPRPNRARARARSADFSNSGDPRRRSPSHVTTGSAQRRAEPPFRSTSHMSVCSRAILPAEP